MPFLVNFQLNHSYLHENFHSFKFSYLLLLLQSWCGFSRLHGTEVFPGFQFVKLWFAGYACLVIVFSFFSLSLQFLAPFSLVL